MESCKNFAKLVNCELNTTVKECEETKNALTKYCSSNQCQGDYKPLVPLIVTLKVSAYSCVTVFGWGNIYLPNFSHWASASDGAHG